MNAQELGARQTALLLPTELRRPIIEAHKEQSQWKFLPNAKNAELLLNTLNDCAGMEIVPPASFKGCLDCKKYVLKFWKHVIEEWQR